MKKKRRNWWCLRSFNAFCISRRAIQDLDTQNRLPSLFWELISGTSFTLVSPRLSYCPKKCLFLWTGHLSPCFLIQNILLYIYINIYKHSAITLALGTKLLLQGPVVKNMIHIYKIWLPGPVQSHKGNTTHLCAA